MCTFGNFLKIKSQKIQERLLLASFQCFILTYVVFCSIILLQGAAVTSTTLIFANKENINRDKKYVQYVPKFTFSSVLSSFFRKLMVIFCLKHKFILLPKVRCSVNNTLDFSQQRCNEMKKKQNNKKNNAVVLFSTQKNIAMVVRGSFPFFNTYLKNTFIMKIMIENIKQRFFYFHSVDPMIKKPVRWFLLQINWLVPHWLGPLS